jgi:multicomponent Na+:H+ antiporter subunit F
MILAFIRMLKGPSLPDRVVAFDVIATIAIGMMVLYAIAAEQPLFLDVAIAMALIVFLGTVAFARCFEKKVTD